MRARVPILALTALTGLALTACSTSPPGGGNPRSAEYAARAVETAANQEITRGGSGDFTGERVIDAANAAAEKIPGVTVTVKDLPEEGPAIEPALPPAFEVTAAGSPPWCVALRYPAAEAADGIALYRAAAGDCTAALKLSQDAADQRAKAYLAVAMADGKAVATEITMLLADATHMGTTPANATSWATYDPQTDTLTLTPGEGAVGVATTVTMLLSSGTTITSSGMTGGAVGAAGPTWCIAVDNNGQVAVYTEAGLQAGKNSCTAEGIPVGPLPNDLSIAPHAGGGGGGSW